MKGFYGIGVAVFVVLGVFIIYSAFQVNMTGNQILDIEDITGNVDIVTIDNYWFSPDMIKVSVGTTVTWVNTDDVEHTVTSLDSLFDSQKLPSGTSFSYTFDSPGEYDYFCRLYPYMSGVIVVE